MMEQMQRNQRLSSQSSIHTTPRNFETKSKEGKKRKNKNDTGWKHKDGKKQSCSTKKFQQSDDGEKTTSYCDKKSIKMVTLPTDVLINVASYVTSPEKVTLMMSIDRELLSHRNRVMSSFIRNMSEQNAIKLFSKLANCGNINAWKWFHLNFDFEDLIHRTFGQWCQSALGWAAQHNHLDLVKLLIDKNDSLEYVHYKPDCGFSALHLAVMNGHLEIVEYFLTKCGGLLVIELKDYGDTVLHRAARAGHVDIIKLLLEHGAMIDNKDNTTPFLETNNKRSEFLEYLVKCGGMINRNYGYTALHCAAANGRTEVVALLAERGALLDIKTVYGQTALHLAAENGHGCVVDILQNLDRGAGMDIQTNNFHVEGWQSPTDMDERQKMINEIVSLIQNRKPNAPQEWLKKVPSMARRLEEPLYRCARSFKAYADSRTLKGRLRQLAQQINPSRTRRFRRRANALIPPHLYTLPNNNV